MSFALVFGIASERNAYKGPAYFGADEYGHGVDTIEEAEAALARYAASSMARLSAPIVAAGIYTGRFVARVRKPCRECAVTGVKAGCKRKKCPACAGRGSTEVVDLVVSV